MTPVSVFRGLMVRPGRTRSASAPREHQRASCEDLGLRRVGGRVRPEKACCTAWALPAALFGRPLAVAQLRLEPCEVARALHKFIQGRPANSNVALVCQQLTYFAIALALPSPAQNQFAVRLQTRSRLVLRSAIVNSQEFRIHSENSRMKHPSLLSEI
jgi:hypothetical protein